MTASGTADRLDYKRAGGRMNAEYGVAELLPQSGTPLASFGVLRLAAPMIEGEIASHRGSASGGVSLDAERGDTARTEAAQYEGDTVRSATVVAVRGPGYAVDGHGLRARTDGSEIELLHGVAGQLEPEARR